MTSASAIFTPSHHKSRNEQEDKLHIYKKTGLSKTTAKFWYSKEAYEAINQT